MSILLVKIEPLAIGVPGNLGAAGVVSTSRTSKRSGAENLFSDQRRWNSRAAD